MRLKTKITAVQANNSAVLRYILAIYSLSPMVPSGIPITSAAAPDFQLIPTALLQALSRKGITQGR